MNSPEIKAFIRENSSLFWYTPQDKKEDIGPELLVEMILNYGNLEQIRSLIKIMGIKEVADVFFYSINLSQRRRGNFYELTVNYFSLVFRQYAS
jgi:hypothetical protein